jgi:hypothetical protein
MQALKRRIEALEQANPNDHNALIVVRFEEPGQPEADSRRISTATDCREGEGWIQLDGEPNDEFTARVHRLVRGSKSGPLLVFADHYKRG